MRRRSCTALLLLIVALGGAPAQAGAAERLLPTDFPGLRAAGKGAAVARGALPRRPTAALRRAATEGAAYRSSSRRLALGVFRLRSTAAARAQQVVLRRARRTVRTRTRVTRIAVVRVGVLIAAVRLQGPRSDAARLGTELAAYVTQVRERLRRLEDRTAWERTLDEIRPDGSITPRTALRAFALAYGPLPGAPRPQGRAGAVEPTLAISMVERVWSRLTAAQRAAIDRRLGAPHDRAQRGRARAALTLTPYPEGQALADKYVEIYERLIPGSRSVVRVFKADEEIIAATTGGATIADALMIREGGAWGVGAVQYCRVRVPPAGQRSIGTPFFELVLAHEVFHCVQQQLLGGGRPRGFWIEEGSADWAANAVFRVSRDVGGGNQRAYFQTPEKVLTGRAYDAVGFWGAAEDLGGAGSLWGKLPGVFRAATAFDSFVLAGGMTLPFRETWASSAFGLPTLGAAWQLRNPFPFSTAEAPVPYASIFDDAGLGSAPYAVKLAVVGPDPDRPLVDLGVRQGAMRAGGSSDLGPVRVDTPLLCLGRCVCPRGKESSIPPFTQVDARTLKLALTGGAEEGIASVRYLSLERFCRDRDPDEPSRPASTNGDPHMTSWDGLFFDFQAVGEYLLARSRSGDLVIQARQEPLRTNKNVTVNTQFALRVGRTRVNVEKPDVPGTPLEVRVDGRPVALPAGTTQALSGGSLVRDADGRVVATWQDGSEFSMRSVGRWGIAASAQLAPGRAGTVSGVLGRFDGNPGNDLADRAGRTIPYRTRELGDGFHRVVDEFERAFFDRLYDTVGEAWRLKQSESLLTYPRGKTTRSFTDRDRPTKPVDPADLDRARRAAAEKVCRDHGVTEPGPLEDCILDVALTGDPAFAVDALAVQDAGQVAWTPLRAGGDRTGRLDLLGTADGALHLGYAARPDAIRHVAVGADGTEGAAETIGGLETAPRLIGGAFGLGALAAELTNDRNGIYRYARGADGTWALAGTVATGGYTYVSQPEALVLADGALMTVAPGAGRSTVFRGEGGPGQDPLPELPDCYTTNPRLAQDGASGAVWLAWVQWDCPETGLFARRLDPATGAPVGPELKAPGSTWGDGRRVDPPLGQELGFTGRPGADGVFLAYVTDDGTNVRVWRVGDAEPATIARPGGQVRRAFVSAEPSGGRLWVGWDEQDRLSLVRTPASGAITGRRRTFRPPPGASPPILSNDHWSVEARSGGAELVYGWPSDGATPGALWHARVTD